MVGDLEHSVSPPLSKGGNPNFENLKKGGGLEKIIWGGGKQKEGGVFQNKRGGNPTFQVEFRDTKGQKWILSETN